MDNSPGARSHLSSIRLLLTITGLLLTVAGTTAYNFWDYCCILLLAASSTALYSIQQFR
jgi:hypothetical protein